MNVDYQLHIPGPIQRRISLMGDRTRLAIHARLTIVLAGARARLDGDATQALGPPLRFYVEQYRIFYQLDPAQRRVVVLELHKAAA